MIPSTVVDHETAPGNYQNLFVAKLPLSVSDGELMAVFAPYKPSSATVMLDPVTGRSKGYAFVLFANADDGRQAAIALDKQIGTVTRKNDANEDTPFTFDLTIFASKHSGKEVAAENECLYIRNIPNSWPMADVEAFIARHGKPVYSAVRSDHLGSPVWVVFVEYDCVESARATLKAVHGMSVAPRCPPILAKFAENEDVKRNRRDRKLGRMGRAPQPVPTDGDAKGDEATAAATNGDGESGDRTNNDTPNPQPAGPRRIDVSQQMHHPCHASRYDENGTRFTIPNPVAEMPAVTSPHFTSANNASHPNQRHTMPLNGMGTHNNNNNAKQQRNGSESSFSDSGEVDGDANGISSSDAALVSSTANPNGRTYSFEIPLPRSKQLALRAAADAAANAAAAVPTSPVSAAPSNASVSTGAFKRSCAVDRMAMMQQHHVGGARHHNHFNRHPAAPHHHNNNRNAHNMHMTGGHHYHRSNGDGFGPAPVQMNSMAPAASTTTATTNGAANNASTNSGAAAPQTTMRWNAPAFISTSSAAGSPTAGADLGSRPFPATKTVSPLMGGAFSGVAADSGLSSNSSANSSSSREDAGAAVMPLMQTCLLGSRRVVTNNGNNRSSSALLSPTVVSPTRSPNHDNSRFRHNPYVKA